MTIDKKVRELIRNIAKNNVSGASELTRQAIKALILQIKISSENLIREVEEVFKLLLKTQPTMAPLINGMGYIMNEILIFNDQIPLNELKKRAIKRGEEFLKESDLAIRRISEISKKFLKGNTVIMTHSMSKTVQSILEVNKDKIYKLIMTESRPQLEGVKFTKVLAGNFPIFLIIDSAIGFFIKNHKIDLILVGADSVLADGSVINKIGTYPLAVLAYENSIPFIVATESFKFNPRSYFGKQIKIEEKSP
ncbi:MAG: translation initiation factor eIF-2B, partial [Candidatus Helarchaeota archaeon]